MVPNDDEHSSQPTGSEKPKATLPAWKWTARALEHLYEINECCLDTLRTLAASTVLEDSAAVAFECVKVHRDLWLASDERALRRAARIPVLLVDVHWQSEEWWPWAKGHGAISVMGALGTASFPPERALELMDMALRLARDAARWDRPTATQVLGIRPAVVAQIDSFGNSDVRRITAEQFREVRPRWENEVKFWGKLLLGALGDNEKSLGHAYRDGIQLLTAEVLSGLR